MRALLVNVGHGNAAADGHPRHHVAPMDLAQVASILEGAGWRTDLWDTAVTPALPPETVHARVAAKAPDLLVVRPLHGTVDTTAALLHASEGGTPLRVVMGPSAPHAADRLLAEGAATAAVIGEPEETFVEAAGAFGRGEIPSGLAGLQTEAGRVPKSRPFLRDLDALPLPAHQLLMRQGYQFRYPLDVDGPLRIGYSLTSRGCALGCIFCAPVERETFGTRYRWRSAEHVCDELELMRSLGANAVYFIDDFFGFSKPRIAELCETMLARGVVMPWAAQVRAQGLDLELLRLMRRAGCSTLCFGAESGSDRILKLIRKGVTTAQIREQASRIHQAGIQLVGYFIVGTPGETDAERAATYQLIEEIRPEVVQLHIFNVFPGAPAMELFPERAEDEATKFTGPQSRDPRVAALDRERREFYRRYYLSPRYIRRTLRRRWRPMLHNLGDELDFVRRSARFFLGAGR